MRINKEALTMIIRATRGSIKLAKATQGLLHEKDSWTEADEVAGRLKDALFFMSEGMTIGNIELRDDEIHTVIAHKMEDNSMSDDEVAVWLMNICKEPEQPAPNLISTASFEEMWKQAGGYLLKAVGGK